MRILDVRTGEIITLQNERLNLDEAVKRKLIDKDLVEDLLKPGAGEDTNSGRSLNLLEVIQKEILEAENGYDTTEKRIKVIKIEREVDGKSTPDVLSQPQTEIQSKSIVDAIQEGLVDTKTGLYRKENGEFIKISDAYKYGYLIQNESVKIKSNSLCLSDAISQELIDENGWIIDRNSGDKFRLDSAVENNLIESNIREIVDTKNDVKITLALAMELGILNSKTGRFLDTKTKEKLTFVEAKSRQLISKPMTLKDVCDLNLFDENNQIQSPMKLKKLSILEAINAGVLDSHNIKSITKYKNSDLINLSDAISESIIIPDTCRYVDLETEELLTIQEAVDRGLISSVCQKSIFNIAGFKHPKSNEFVPFNEALGENILRKNNETKKYEIKNNDGTFTPLKDGIELGLVRPEVYEMLNRPIGVTNPMNPNDEFKVIDLVYNNLIDTKTGFLLAPQTKAVVPLNTAIENKFITPDGALLLSSLLNITLTTETVTKTIKRYVTVTQTGMEMDDEDKEENMEITEKILSFTEAVRNDLIDEDKQVYRDPSTGNVYTIQQALNYGLLLPDTESENFTNERIIPITLEKSSDQIPITSKSPDISHVITQQYDLPSEGWYLGEAIDRKLLDPVSGLFIIEGTDRLVSFEECIKLKIINPSSAHVIDPKNKRNLTLVRALEKKVLDTTGHYISPNENINMTLKEAIRNRRVILDIAMQLDLDNSRQILITKTLGKADSVEIKTKTPELISPEPLQLAPGVIYDPSTALVIFTETGQSANILQAINEGKLDPNLVAIKDFQTGNNVPLDEAIRRGLVNPNSGEIKDPSGRKITMIDAIKLGALAVVGAPLVAAAGAINSLRMVMDPSTGKEIPIELAYERGLVGKEELLTPEKKRSSFDDVEERRIPSEGELTRARVTTEPKYKVSIGRAKSITNNAKPVILQKMRKKVVRPQDAVETGLIDKDTADILENKQNFTSKTGKNMNIVEAVSSNSLDGRRGHIRDPQRGDILNINQAIERGILDPQGTNQILVPLAKSLSVPQLKEQGLINPENSKIFHPETGSQLSLREAIVCDIVDPLSKLRNQNGSIVSLKEAIANGDLDEETSILTTQSGDSVDLLTAVDLNLFEIEQSKSLEDIPLAGMTFPVALQRGLIDSDSKEIIHPITKDRKLIKSAINDDFIMAVPYPPSPDSVEIQDALDSKLIDSQNCTFRNPKTGELVPVGEAIEKGLLVIKPITDMIPLHASEGVTSVTETLTSVHTITTKTIEILSGYTLLSANEIQNLQTGEIIPMEKAKEQGIVKDEFVNRNKIEEKEIKISFSEALQRGLIDITKGEYTDPQSGEVISLAQAVSEGILETGSPTDSNSDKDSKLTIDEAIDNLYDDTSKKFRDPKNQERLLDLEEAMKEGIIDSESMIVDIESGKAQTLNESVRKGLIDGRTGEIKQKSGDGINVKEAAKLGLLAIVGAPVLAGMAVAGAIKKAVSKSEKPEASTEAKKPINQSEITVDSSKTPLIAQPQIEEVEQVKAKENIIPIKREVESTNKRISTVFEEESDEVGGSEDVEEIIKDKSPDRHVTFASPDTTTAMDDSKIPSLRMTIKEAVEEEKIDPKTCRIIINNSEIPETVQEALIQEQIYPLDLIDILSDNLVQLITEDSVVITIDENLTPEKLTELGIYDPETETFIDPQTDERISFQNLIYKYSFFNPDLIYVKDFRSQKFEPLKVALEKPLIDKNTGHMVDSKTGKRIPFFECIRRGWIIQREPVQSESLQDVLDAGKFITTTGEIIISGQNETVPVTEALRAGILDSNSVSIRDPATGTILPLTQAIELGIVDLKHGVIVNRDNNTELDINQAYQEGYLLEGSRKPISLEAAVKKGLYNPTSGRILDTITEQLVDIQESVDRGIVDPSISDVKDTKENKLVPLQEALDSDLVDSKTGKLKDTKLDQYMTLDDAVDKDMITTKPVTMSLIEALAKELYNPTTGKILSPVDGNETTLKDSIASKFVSIDTVLVKDELNEKIIPAKEAIAIKLLNDETGILTRPELKLDKAYQKGYLLSTEKPVTLTDALIRGLYNPETGIFTIDGVEQTLEDAINNGEISVHDLIVKDPRTGNIISLSSAIRGGLVNPHLGLAYDPTSGIKMTLLDALERGILIQPKRSNSLPDAVFKGLYDPKSGQFNSTMTREKLTAERAIRRGIIDPESTMIKLDNKVLPFELAVENGLIDVKRGLITDEYGNKIDFLEAFDRGLMIEIRKPIRLMEAILRGIYRSDTHNFVHPQTGKKLNLSQAIEQNLIDPNSVQLKNPQTELYQDISLIDKINEGLIDGEQSFVVVGDMRLTLAQAFEIGMFSDSRAPISLQRAIKHNIYDEKTGKITDPITGRKITLHDAMRKFIINPELACYFDEVEEKLLNLNETCRQKLIDRREGVFKEPGSDNFISLTEALSLGLIVDIEGANFGLYETLAMGLYDKQGRYIIHPVAHNFTLTISDAVRLNIINPDISIVKNIHTNKYVRLNEAFDNGLISPYGSCYVISDSEKIDLQDARKRGLIVPSQKLMSMEKCIQVKLYQPETGKFIDPIKNEYLNLKLALDTGLIDTETTIFKDFNTGSDVPLKSAIDAGDVIVEEGKVIDRKSKNKYNYDQAFTKGLLVTVQRPITGEAPVKRLDSLDLLLLQSPQVSPNQPREMSLDEAIKNKLIDVDNSYIKDPRTNKYVTVKSGLQDGLIDLEKRAVIDPKSLFFVFDKNLFVYVREPITFDHAVESNLLNLSSGKLRYPAKTSSTEEADVADANNVLKREESYTLKEACEMGILDPDSALIKDGAKMKLLRLPEAFRKGVFDAEQANVLDTTTSKLNTLENAYESGLLITPKRSFSLFESLQYNLYNPVTGHFNDPFLTNSDNIIERKRLTLNECIQTGLIDPTSTMVRDTVNSNQIITLNAAIQNGILDPSEGRLNIVIDNDNTSDNNVNSNNTQLIDLVKAKDKGYLLPADKRVSYIKFCKLIHRFLLFI